MVKLIVTERKLGVEWYPLSVSGYSVAVLTQNLIVQFGLSFSSAAISIIYVLTALAWIVYGFRRRYAFIRRFGLGLAVLAVIKLFLIDLASLTQGYQIVSYFSLGITLIAISFVYQYFSRRLEIKEGTFAGAGPAGAADGEVPEEAPFGEEADIPPPGGDGGQPEGAPREEDAEESGGHQKEE
jgi:hypothetical protein